MAGRTWLDANADGAAAFTALQATSQPPPLPELDQILAQVLSDRFRLLANGSSLKQANPRCALTPF